MDTQTQTSISQVGQPLDIDSEVDLVRVLVHSVTRAGICSDPPSVINLYVALKSKPLVILSGPDHMGKVAMVECLARVLVGGDCFQSQMMEGHPWSAGKSGNLAFFSEIHTRYNSEKLLCLIEEAWQLENMGKIFLACLARISPAEVDEFFSQVAYQLRHKEIVQYGDIHFLEPIPYPPNLFIIGTIDTKHFNGWNEDLLSTSTVIQWPKKLVGGLHYPVLDENFPAAEKTFLESCLRDGQAVYKKLSGLLGWHKEPLLPLFQVESLLQTERVPLPPTLFYEASTYLANSWSEKGAGLFHPDSDENLAIALDFVISQIYLPRVVGRIRDSEALEDKLQLLLSGKFPRSAAQLASMAAG